MARVLSEARKALREKALARRQGATELEMADKIKQKYFRLKSEKDLHLKLPEGEPARLVSQGGYQLFDFRPERIYALTHLRDFFFRGYGAKLFMKRCLTHMELNIALGLPMSRLKQLIMAREFPPPLGEAYTSQKGEPVPAYTIREAGVYSKILADELGQTDTHDYWHIHKARVAPILFAARRQMHKVVFEDGDKSWRLKDEK